MGFSRAAATPPIAEVNVGRAPASQAPDRSQRALLQLYLDNPELRRPVHAIARHFSSCEFYAALDDGERADRDHPLAELLRRPNRRMAGKRWRLLSSVWRDVAGEMFEFIDHDPVDGVQVYPIPAHWVTVKLGVSPTYQVDYPNGARRVLSDEQVVWLGEANPLDPYGRGVGTARAAADEAETSEMASSHTLAFFRNGAHPEGIIYLGGADAATARQAEADWGARHQGTAHTTHFISGPPGAFGYQRLSTDFGDLGVLDLRRQAADVIRELYGVPPEVVGQLQHSNRATIEAALYILSTMITEPRAGDWQEERNELLLPRVAAMVPTGERAAWEEARIAHVSMIPEDKAATREQMGKTAWAYTVNEHRESVGLAPRAGGDVYIREPNRHTAVDAGEIEDMTRHARLITRATPPPLPSGPRLSDMPANVVLLRVVPETTTRAIDDAAIDEALRALQPERVPAALLDPLESTLRAWAAKGALEGAFELTSDMINPFVTEYLEAFEVRLADETGETTREKIRASLIAGVRAGEGITQLTERVRTSTAFNRSRAELIARTEVARAANSGKYRAYQVMREAGVLERVQWVSTLDKRTRPTHAALNGQVREVGKAFSVAGVSALHPGAFSDPSQNVRCRCTVVGAFDDEGKAVRDLGPVWKTFDEELADDDAAAIEACQGALDAQRDAIIAALETLAQEAA